MINGKAAADFYAQFLYREEGGRYRYLASEQLSAIPGSTSHVMDVAVFLGADGAYAAVYRELEQVDASRSSELSRRVVRGRWSVRSERLVLDGLGNGTGFAFNGKDAVDLRVDTNGGDTLLVFVRGTASMEMMTR